MFELEQCRLSWHGLARATIKPPTNNRYPLFQIQKCIGFASIPTIELSHNIQTKTEIKILQCTYKCEMEWADLPVRNDANIHK